MSAVSAAERGRRLAESLMTATCTIRAASGEPVMDPDTLEIVAAPGEIVYAGKCRVRPAGQQGTATEAGGAELRQYDFIVSVPFSVTAAHKGQRLTVDSSPDVSLTGLQIEVQDVARGDHISARRLFCTEVS